MLNDRFFADWLETMTDNRTYVSDILFPFGVPDYAPALIGHSQPKHPAIFRGIRFVIRAIDRFVEPEVWTDRDEDEESYGSFGDDAIPLWQHALARFRDRLWAMAKGWESQPIWDEAKRAAIKAEFDAKQPKTITFTRDTSRPAEMFGYVPGRRKGD